MTHRIEQINQLIRCEISELLQHKVKDPRLDTFVAVTAVTTSPDLRHAKIFVSRISTEEEKQQILKALTAASGFLRREMTRHLKLRRIPELNFRWDDSIEHGDHLLKLMDQVHQD
ncbi:MAG: 30S ribosome-binding factor RbfA [Dehalococcoidales bacterium]|nr:30S ribosome-binding factor RbfA [Dehalococcoidales bacterium]